MDQLCFPYDEIISFRQQKEITICIYYVSGTLDVAHLLTQTSLRSLLLLETQNQKLGYPDRICRHVLHLFV